MLSVLIFLVIPVVIYYFLPKLLQNYSHKPSKDMYLLIVAGILIFISQFLPSPKIDGQDTQFMTHLVGGGIFCGFIWLFVVRNLKLKLGIVWQLLSLFALVCTFGVANELFELFLVKSGILVFSIADTSWDLLANTIGALLFWVGYRAYLYFQRDKE